MTKSKIRRVTEDTLYHSPRIEAFQPDKNVTLDDEQNECLRFIAYKYNIAEQHIQRFDTPIEKLIEQCKGSTYGALYQPAVDKTRYRVFLKSETGEKDIEVIEKTIDNVENIDRLTLLYKKRMTWIKVREIWERRALDINCGQQPYYWRGYKNEH